MSPVGPGVSVQAGPLRAQNDTAVAAVNNGGDGVSLPEIGLGGPFPLRQAPQFAFPRAHPDTAAVVFREREHVPPGKRWLAAL